jgi:hypothetical protein
MRSDTLGATLVSATNRSVGLIAAVVTAAALVGALAGPAEAYPITLTADDVDFLNGARGNFPGDDDQLLIVGRQICRLLYTGQSTQAVIATVAAEYGANPDQAAVVLRAARGTLCTRAPG